MYLRFSGSPGQVAQAENRLTGAISSDSDEVVRKIQNLEFPVHHHLWRWDAPSGISMEQPGLIAFDWGGRLRWLDSLEPPIIDKAHGVVTCFKPGEGTLNTWSNRNDPVGWVQERLKTAFDPQARFVDYPKLRHRP